jgi:dihydrolipoamide dehydrogenase
MKNHDVDVAILGAGTAGMAAYREVVKQTDRVALIDGGPLGKNCARVGCMPSKLLIAAADAAHEARHVARFGISAGPVTVDGVAVMDRVRRERDRFVGFVMDAVDGFDDHHLIRQNARFVDDNTLELDDGTCLTARAVIIATGSRPIVPPPFEVAGDRLIFNDDVFDWRDLPRSVAVFGAGVIGLELGQALSRLGVRVHLFGLGNSVGPLSDPDLVAYARETFSAKFAAHFHADTEISRDGDEMVVRWTDRNDASDTGEERFDWLLAATGRRPNLDRIGTENTSLVLDDRGAPRHDRQSMRAETTGHGLSSIFVTGRRRADRRRERHALSRGLSPRASHRVGGRVFRPADRHRRARPPRVDAGRDPLCPWRGLVRGSGPRTRHRQGQGFAARLCRARNGVAAGRGNDRPSRRTYRASAGLDHREQADRD